jgi:nicotinate-nucleotide adenylyltransferase
MRLGLFGGTFDPIHLGHLILAESCREACGLDRVWFVVAGAPPHKPGERTSASDRLEMVRIAVAGHPAFEVSDLETHRPGPHYSVETLEAIHRERPDDELFFLIGADSLTDLPSWRQPGRIAQLATIVAVNRPGIDMFDPTHLPDLGPGTRPIQVVAVPPIGIASHDLRRRVAEGRSIRYQVSRGVEAYIEAQGLYRRPAPGGSA